MCLLTFYGAIKLPLTQYELQTVLKFGVKREVENTSKNSEGTKMTVLGSESLLVK